MPYTIDALLKELDRVSPGRSSHRTHNSILRFIQRGNLKATLTYAPGTKRPHYEIADTVGKKLISEFEASKENQ